MGISKTNILLVAAATIILSGLLLVSGLNEEQEALAGSISFPITCEYVFLPSDPVELSVTKTPFNKFRTMIVETDTLDCVDSTDNAFVRELTIIIIRDTNVNNVDKGTQITMITCDTLLHAKESDPAAAIEPDCSQFTPPTNVLPTNCLPGKGVSYIETDSEHFVFTNMAGKDVQRSKLVTLLKSVLGCDPDSNGEPQKFYEFFTLFETFGTKTITTQQIFVCVKIPQSGSIGGCKVLVDVSNIPSGG